MSDNIHVRDSMSWNVNADGLEFRAAEDGDGLTVTGYIARFAEPTVIEDWMGNYTEEIKRGAFTRTLAERGAAKIKMQFNHGSDPAFGALPVGVWTDLREDRKGLFGEGRIHDTWHTVPIRAAIESGALDGMSFKFKVIADQWRKADPKTNALDHRTLTEVALYEAGVVVHQAYEGTTVALRSQALDMWRQELSESKASAGTYKITVNNNMDRTHLGKKLTDILRDYESSGRALPLVGAGTMSGEVAVAPVGDTPVKAEAVPPVGITRREMRIRALSALEMIPRDSDRGAA